MRLVSPAFPNGGRVPAKYTCDGENINPPLLISDVPEDAASLVLIVDDPDAPGGTWVHWTAWNIDPEINGIGEKSAPQSGIEGVTSFGSVGYGGPCPPSGTHRYRFKLFALSEIISLSSSAKISDIEKAMEGKIIEQAELVGLYERRRSK